MRSSLIPGLLETMRFNLAQQVRSLKIFETGKVFIAVRPRELPEEPEIIAGLWTGARASALLARQGDAPAISTTSRARWRGCSAP